MKIINNSITKLDDMPKNTRADESTLHPATSKGSSLRTTIPAFIVSQFELRQGDKIRWRIEGTKIVIEPQ